MSSPFVATNLTSLYDGTALAGFRSTAGVTLNTPDLLNDIESLDRRIATFEKVTIPTTSTATATAADYPYDGESVKREFLEEVLTLLIRSAAALNSHVNPISNDPIVTTSGVVREETSSVGGTKAWVLYDPSQNAAMTSGGSGQTGGWTNFANHTPDDNLDHYFGTGPSTARTIFAAYKKLVTDTFAEGAKIANASSDSTQVITAIPPITIEGVTYDGLATVPQGSALPAKQYLVATAPGDLSKVTVGTELTNVNPTTRLLLDPRLATAGALYGPDAASQDYTVPGTLFTITLQRDPATGKVQSLTDITLATSDPANPLVSASPDRIVLPMMDTGADVTSPSYDPLIPSIVTSRRFSVGANDYLVSLSQDQTKVYLTPLGASQVAVSTVKGLTGSEYLLHMNEVRIKILRGQLAYNEAVVREIQDDLRRANETLSDLEKQAGAITETDGSNAQYTVETTRMSLFNATASNAGASMFERAGPDSYHNKKDWGSVRATLKNYIDRRSSEAQQATLDYQNVLNRYNGAYETMAKLQEKLDNLLKGQLRNLA